MEQWLMFLEQWFNIIVFVFLLTLGYVVGRWQESRHFKSIREREQQLAAILAFSERKVPAQFEPCSGILVSGAVVVSVDYFKVIAAGLRGLIGGRINAFETLVERGRREALLRMKQDAASKGASAIFNVRLETSSISKGQKNQIGAVEVYAYGTALIPR